MNKALSQFSNEKQESLVESASWLDDIKSRNMNAFNKMHYEPISILKDNQRPLLKDETGFYAVKTLKKNLDTLLNWDRNSLKNPFSLEKSTALRFFVHILGDIHQPLHAATLVSRAFPRGDRGGNFFRVTLNRAKMNLHAVYDQMFRKTKFDRKPFKTGFMQYLIQYGAQLTTEYPETQEKEPSFAEIANESNRIARNQVYPGVYNNSALTPEYIQKGFSICKQRVALAGYRLKYFMLKIYESYKKHLIASEGSV